MLTWQRVQNICQKKSCRPVSTDVHFINMKNMHLFIYFWDLNRHYVIIHINNNNQVPQWDRCSSKLKIPVNPHGNPKT